MNSTSKFLEDGLVRHERVYFELIAEVRAEVEAEFAEQLAGASWWQRVKLRRAIRKEVARRSPRRPSPSSLYAGK